MFITQTYAKQILERISYELLAGGRLKKHF